MPTLTANSLDFLRSSRNADGGWSYYAAGQSAIEPTALVVAALHVHASHPDLISAGLKFISGLQQSDGAIVPQPGQSQPTSMSLIAGLSLALDPAFRPAAERVADHALSWSPETSPSTPDIVNDGSLIGFAWRPGTISWVEPTAYGLLLLDRLGRSDHPRVAEARKLLLDRAVPSGGWNYGNSIVLGAELEAVVMTTALALLALWRDRDGKQVLGGLEYLRRESATHHSDTPLSLGWMSLALRARGESVIAESRIAESLQLSTRVAASPWHHAMALLAVGPLDRNPFVLGAAA